jgi:hypothetical protein
MRKVMSLDDYVSSAVSDTGTPAILLGEKERQVMVIRLRERLGVDVSRYRPWDKNDDVSEGKQRVDGWELIPTYVGEKECLMFLDDGRSIWKFRDGSDLLRVLGDCPAIEFYVTDEEASYLLCHNHHDFVIGWGEASQWVKQLAD